MTRQCVEFTINEDFIIEPEENFTITLTSGDDVVLNPDVAVVTIVDGIGRDDYGTCTLTFLHYLAISLP